MLSSFCQKASNDMSRVMLPGVHYIILMPRNIILLE